MRCATCSKPELVEIRMTVAGKDLVFRRCGRCENQEWAGASGAVALHHVLELARAH